MQKEDAEKNVVSLTSELDKLLDEVATLKKAAKLAHQKRKVCNENLSKRDGQIAKMGKKVEELQQDVELRIHNSMEIHIYEFVKSSTFSNIVDLYCLPTMVLAFSNCRKKVKAQHLEVDITNITLGPQEEGLGENDESLIADFQPEVTLKWDGDENGRVVFLSSFNYEFVPIDKEEV
ncbi:hypothetical protein SLEP1_g13941 [Rubroshorea leprosula]|uniref:Uncharacterized protein n=1 Tax=Rubroshorea leprosula TaxID=152421 RepID=A0AAV5INA5_9ROSI|nr:hypothetical protein SLEP1_g13941 [Rubroshorea leprosula]